MVVGPLYTGDMVEKTGSDIDRVRNLPVQRALTYVLPCLVGSSHPTARKCHF